MIGATYAGMPDTVPADELSDAALADLVGGWPLRIRPRPYPTATKRRLLLQAVRNRFPGGRVPIDSIPEAA